MSDELDASVTDPDQSLSEEQSYRETMRGIRSFMGWTHIPDMDTTAGSSDETPLLDLDCNPQARFLLSYLQTSGSAKNLLN